MTGKKWSLKDNVAPTDVVGLLAARRGIDLSQRPSWSLLSDFENLGGVGEACDRIRGAIKRKETVGIIGDYDADGITGTVQLVRFLRRNGIEPEVIIPHRIKHGYGVRRSFMEDFHAKDVSLIITVDTGIAAVNEISHARFLGMDVIVADHHIPFVGLPDATIVHPFAKSWHSNPDLSGSGVVFTLIRALEKDDWEEKNVDVALAAIGTVADVSPLTKENRIIVSLGIEAMNRRGGNPVFELARSTLKADKQITGSHIGFRIAPRINAAGRIADPRIGYKALLEGGESIQMLTILNEKRQKMVMSAMEEVKRMIDVSQPILMLSSPSFHPGIIGLIAGKLCDKYGRPALIGSMRAGVVTCSLRSIGEYHITKALERCGSHLDGFGGHAAAAGCKTSCARWAAFADALKNDAADKLKGVDLAPTIEIDLVLDAKHITLELARDIARLKPFGEGNAEPKFLLENQSVSGMRVVGKDGSHLQCFVGGVKAVGFGLGHLMSAIPGHADIVCRIGIDKWNGFERAQIYIEDAAPSRDNEPIP